MQFKFLKTRDGKRYIFPASFFQDTGTHYIIDFFVFQRKIPKGAVDSETDFSVQSILKGIGIVIIIILVLNAIF